MKFNNYLLTGATGFVGSALIKRLLKNNVRITATVLDGTDSEHLPSEVKRIIVQPLSESSDYSNALQNMDIVIHLAARVHVMNETAVDPLQEFRNVNLRGTERLARQAAQAGLKRFVFMSTIGVNGNYTSNRAFTEDDTPFPHNYYSLSKFEAEVCLRQICAETGMDVVIVRAPLVYGPGNPGNFLSLLRIINKGIPIPLASVSNLKSFLYVKNLVDALACCAIHPKAAGQTFLVSDGEDVSTSELLHRVAFLLGKPARVFPFPVRLLRIAGRVLGKSSAVERLVGALQVDSSKIRRDLGWIPPFTLEEGLAETTEWFKNNF